MAAEKSPRAVVFWNTWYRADPGKQLDYITELRGCLESEGFANPTFCLSEVTSGAAGGLLELLQQDGFSTSYRPTSTIKDFGEGLCFAQAGPINEADFTCMGTARAIANTKTRWLGKIDAGSDQIFSTHASYPHPTSEEQALIQDAVRLGQGSLDLGGVQVLGGDFNTVVGKSRFIDKIEAAGLRKVRAEGRVKNTVTLGSAHVIGVELDHVFVSADTKRDASLEVLPKGPSNHAALLLRLV